MKRILLILILSITIISCEKEVNVPQLQLPVNDARVDVPLFFTWEETGSHYYEIEVWCYVNGEDLHLVREHTSENQYLKSFLSNAERGVIDYYHPTFYWKVKPTSGDWSEIRTFKFD